RRKYWLPRYSMTACRRETMASGSTTSLEGSRPIETIVRASAISRREEEVGLMISFAIAAAALSSKERLAPRDPDPDPGPLLHAGRELPGLVGADDRFVHVAAGRLHDLHVADLARVEHDEGDGHGGALTALEGGRVAGVLRGLAGHLDRLGL